MASSFISSAPRHRQTLVDLDFLRFVVSFLDAICNSNLHAESPITYANSGDTFLSAFSFRLPEIYDDRVV